MTVCEFLHCSFSELPSRCRSLADKLMILKYVEEKGIREKRAMDNQPPPPTTPTVPRRGK